MSITNIICDGVVSDISIGTESTLNYKTGFIQRSAMQLSRTCSEYNIVTHSSGTPSNTAERPGSSSAGCGLFGGEAGSIMFTAELSGLQIVPIFLLNEFE